MNKPPTAETDKPAPSNSEPRELKALLFLFFFSGFPALIYQLVWQRALFRIFGVNIESVTITVTAFMLGLGIGSLAGGILSRNKNYAPLLVLAGIEILIAAFGYFSMQIFEISGTYVLGKSLSQTAAVTLALVIVPTFLMGATLPLLVAYLVRRSKNVGASVGRLYYVNTLGAGAVCIIAALILFPFMQSMQGAVNVAVAMNIAIAAGALFEYGRGKRLRTSQLSHAQELSPTHERPLMKFGPALALGFFGGFVSLSYEIFFFRTISFSTGNSASDFTFTLGAFLIGLASGARIIAEHSATQTGVAKKAIAGLVMATFVGFLFLPLITHFGVINVSDRHLITAIALLMVFFIAQGWGRLLPSLAHLGISVDDKAGLKTAFLYLANIVGSASGCIITGFILMDRMGLVELARILSISASICIVIFVYSLRYKRVNRLIPISQAVLLTALAVFALPLSSKGVLEALLWKGAPNQAGPFMHVVENRSGILTVDQNSVVYGNGIYDGMFNTSINHGHNGMLRPYALSFYNKAPRQVLQIGLSSGSWAQAIANNPEVDELTIIEINPGYLDMIASRPEVSSILTNPKVTIIIDDGRRWLRQNPNRKFDAVISNTTFHFRSNSTNLLSAEFLNLVKQHLNPDGTFFYNTTDSARVQKTGCSVFPYGARFANHMIVSMSPIDFDVMRWKRTLFAQRIDNVPVLDKEKSMDRAFFHQLEGTLRYKDHTGRKAVEPCPEILARTQNLRPITDDNMGTEWRHQYGLE